MQIAPKLPTVGAGDAGVPFCGVKNTLPWQNVMVKYALVKYEDFDLKSRSFLHFLVQNPKI